MSLIEKYFALEHFLEGFYIIVLLGGFIYALLSMGQDKYRELRYEKQKLEEDAQKRYDGTNPDELNN